MRWKHVEIVDVYVHKVQGSNFCTAPLTPRYMLTAQNSCINYVIYSK